MDDADDLTQLDPAYKSMLRLQLAIAALVLLVAPPRPWLIADLVLFEKWMVATSKLLFAGMYFMACDLHFNFLLF